MNLQDISATIRMIAAISIVLEDSPVVFYGEIVGWILFHNNLKF